MEEEEEQRTHTPRVSIMTKYKYTIKYYYIVSWGQTVSKLGRAESGGCLWDGDWELLEGVESEDEREFKRERIVN